MKNPYIWVLYDVFETDTLFSNLEGDNLDIATAMIHEHLVREEGSEAPTAEEVKRIIINEVISGTQHSYQFIAYTLQREELNVGEENIRYTVDPEFKAEPGAKVFEAGQRIELGDSDLAYAIVPAGYFTKKLDHKDFDNIEWVERILK